MKKSTKRFAQKHLKGAIQQRKATQFAKKRHNIMMSKLEDRAARGELSSLLYSATLAQPFTRFRT